MVAAADTAGADAIPSYGGPWFDSPFFAALRERPELSEPERDEIERFARDGYLLLDRDRLGIDDFESLADRILLETNDLYRGAGRVQDGWAVSDAVRQLALAPGILSLLATLYQREPLPFQSLNFARGTQQPTHSDTFHFHCLPKFFMCGVWVALEDADEDNGPVHYYPASHRLPDIDVLDLGAPAVGNRDASALEDSYSHFVGRMLVESGLPRRRLTVPRGQALLWAANLYHGGDPVQDPTRTRHSQVTHYYFKNCLYYTPMRSDPGRGRLAVRRVRNIGTGRYEPLRYDGRRIPVSLSDRIRWYGPPLLQRVRRWNRDSRRF